MLVFRSAAAATVLAAVLIGVFGATWAVAQVPRTLKDFGDPVLEGWYDNPNGSITLLMGYFNRYLKQKLEIPVGETNFLAPGPPDQGQPTIFPPGRG